MSLVSLPCLPRLVNPNPNSRPFPYPNWNPTRIRIHRFACPLKAFSLELSKDHRNVQASSPGDLLLQLSLSSVLLFGLGLSGLWVFSSPALARIPPPSIAQQQETPEDGNDVEKFANVENFGDERVKAAFELWKSKTYALTVPLKIVALEGSLPPIWIREFLRSQGKRVKLQPVFRRSLKDIFHELSDPPSKRKINPKSAAVADVVALGDSWLNFAIEKGLIEPMKGLEEKDWFNDLSDKWKVYLRRSSEGTLDSQGRIWAVPYRWGSMVIAYNKKEFLKHKLSPVEDWSDLWRPDLAGKISMVDSSREIVGAVLKYIGASYNTSNIDSEVVGGRHAVQQQLDLLFQQVRLFDSQHYLKAFKAGDVWVAVGWSSDVLPMAKTMSNIAVIVPKSGASLWADFWKGEKNEKVVGSSLFPDSNQHLDGNKMISDCKTPTNSISTISVQSAPNIMEELSNAKDIFRTIEQVLENNEVGSFWVYARIVSIESHGGWWYLSCKKCPKKMIVVGDKFYCEKCDKFDTIGNIRFKIQVRVVDSTGNAIFLLWDREAIELIGKTALELKTEMENQGTESVKIPKDFEYLVDRNIIFKVQVRSNQIRGYNGTYTVIKLIKDPTVVENYCREFLDSQESDMFSKLNDTETRDVEVLSSGDEISTPIKSTSKGVPSKDVLNDSTLKRALIDEFSSTAPDKKLKTIIKQEKD